MAISKARDSSSKDVVRLNLQIPRALKAALDEQASKLNMTIPQLAREFLRQGLDALKRQELDEQLVAGYQYLAQEDRQLLDEFQDVDLEGWEEDEHAR